MRCPMRMVVKLANTLSGAEGRVDDHEGRAGDRAGARRCRDRRRRGPRAGAAAQHRVDDQLEGPGLEQLERADQAHLGQRPQDAPAVRPEVTGDPPGEAAHFTSRAGVERRRVVQPRPPCHVLERVVEHAPERHRVAEQPRAGPRGPRPRRPRRPWAGRASGRRPRISAADARIPRARREVRSAHFTLSTRRSPPWFSVHTLIRPRDQTPPCTSRSQSLQPWSTSTKYFRCASTSTRPCRMVSFSRPSSVQNAAENARFRHDQGSACMGRSESEGSAAAEPAHPPAVALERAEERPEVGQDRDEQPPPQPVRHRVHPRAHRGPEAAGPRERDRGRPSHPQPPRMAP